VLYYEIPILSSYERAKIIIQNAQEAYNQKGTVTFFRSKCDDLI